MTMYINMLHACIRVLLWLLCCKPVPLPGYARSAIR